MMKSRDKGTPSLPTELRARFGAAQFVAKGDAAEVFRIGAKGDARALKIFSDVRVWERELRVATTVLPSSAPALREVVRMVDGGNAIHALCYEWIDGLSLDDWMSTRARAQGIRSLRGAIVQLARVLADLSDAGWRHGDIKPANILVASAQKDAGAPDVTHLLDWSLAAPLGDRVEGFTPYFAAPEVVAGEVLSVQADVYALGKLVMECVERHPWVADDRELVDLARELLLEKPTHRPTPKEIVRRLAASEKDHLGWQVRMDRALLAECALGEGFSFPVLQSAPAIEQVKCHLRDAGMRVEEAQWSTLRKMRWLVRILGPRASYWSRAIEESETKLYRALATLSKNVPCASVEEEALLEEGRAYKPRANTETFRESHFFDWWSAPSRGPRWIEEAEAWLQSAQLPSGAHTPLLEAVLRALLRQGQFSEVLRRTEPMHSFQLLRMEALRRLGDYVTLKREWDARVASKESGEGEADGRAYALYARTLWDLGNTEDARAALSKATGARAKELEALLADPTLESLEAIELAARLEQSEDRARLFGAAGLLAHRLGLPSRALTNFRSAVDEAIRIESPWEEATYLVGLAASAADDGDLAQAVALSTHAALRWEALGVRDKAAYAYLARAASLAELGLVREVDEAAEVAIQIMGRSTPTLALYVRLAQLDARIHDGDFPKALLEQAKGLTRSFADEVLVGARVLRAASPAERAALRPLIGRLRDEGKSVPITVRLEAWTAVLHLANTSGGASPDFEDDAIAELLTLRSHNGSPILRLRALWSLDLAAQRLGSHRKLNEALAEIRQTRAHLSRELLAKCPPEWQGRLRLSPWMDIPQGRDLELDPFQRRQLEMLVAGLTTQIDAMDLLLRDVLDTMIRWTGVERGLVLVRSGERLEVAAARNMHREELEGEQLSLSRSLSLRAFDTGEVVVATDALSSLGDAHASIHALKIRSVLVVPLRLRGEVVGAVYLDDRFRRGAFGEKETEWVKLIATLAAFAMVEAQEQQKLRKALGEKERERTIAAAEAARMEGELSLAKEQLRTLQGTSEYSELGMVGGASTAFRHAVLVAKRAAASNAPVILSGESGTGKELFARLLWKLGGRKNNAFVSENVAAIPETLLESILFGHVRGAFTGAHQAKAGLFEMADGGVLFLDEIGELPVGLQSKLLRALETGVFRPVGGDIEKRVDLRIVVATNRDLEKMVAAGSFRADLYYRLNVVEIRLPPLRERKEDLPLLVEAFLKKYGEGKAVDRGALVALEQYDWPGNVRQLENELRKACLFAGGTILREHLSDAIRVAGERVDEGTTLRSKLDALEKRLVKEALEKHKGNQSAVSRELGISRFGLQKMMKRLAIKWNG